MGAPPAPVVKKGGGVGLIAGIVIGAIVIGAGGYFGYKKCMGPKEPGAEVAQTQQPPAGQDQGVAAPVQTPSPVETAPAQPPVTPVQPPSTQTQPPSKAYQPPPQGGGQRPVYATPSGAIPPSRQEAPAQQPAYTPPPQQTQPAAPAYTPPPSRPPSQPVEERQPILRPERSYPPAPVTPAQPQTTAPPASTAARYTGPSSGMLMWSGKLDRNSVVTIDGSSASTGTLTGSLPGVPVTLETDLTNVGFAEMPSPSNGWKKVSLRSKKSQNIVVNIRWRVID
jgi:hypothetical protein